VGKVADIVALQLTCHELRVAQHLAVASSNGGDAKAQ